MNLLLLVNPVQYKTLIIFLIVLISIQTLQPINVLAFQGAEIIPISIEILRPPYAEGVVIGTVAATIISTIIRIPKPHLSIKSRL